MLAFIFNLGYFSKTLRIQKENTFTVAEDASELQKKKKNVYHRHEGKVCPTFDLDLFPILGLKDF